MALSWTSTDTSSSEFNVISHFDSDFSYMWPHPEAMIFHTTAQLKKMFFMFLTFWIPTHCFAQEENSCTSSHVVLHCITVSASYYALLQRNVPKRKYWPLTHHYHLISSYRIVFFKWCCGYSDCTIYNFSIHIAMILCATITMKNTVKLNSDIKCYNFFVTRHKMQIFCNQSAIFFFFFFF